MTDSLSTDEVSVSIREWVATVEIQRPPHNFFDFSLIQQLAGIYEELDVRDDCRAAVLCSQGKNFCAGANFQARESWGTDRLDAQAGQLYIEAIRMFRTNLPVVAAVQGAAVGGGLGLAMSADFRVTCAEGRFSANFVRLAFHHGFGLSATLPRAIGHQKAELMLMTGRRVKGEEAVAWGLAEALVPLAQVRQAAWDLARDIAEGGPLALAEIRKTQRGDLAHAVQRATDHELTIQNALRDTEDFQEGIKATAERRAPAFKSR